MVEGGPKHKSRSRTDKNWKRGNTHQVAARVRSATMVNPGVSMVEDLPCSVARRAQGKSAPMISVGRTSEVRGPLIWFILCVKSQIAYLGWWRGYSATNLYTTQLVYCVQLVAVHSTVRHCLVDPLLLVPCYIRDFASSHSIFLFSHCLPSDRSSPT